MIGFRQAVGLLAQGQQRGIDATGRVFAFKEPSVQLMVCHISGRCRHCQHHRLLPELTRGLCGPGLCLARRLGWFSSFWLLMPACGAGCVWEQVSAECF
jgi:hypothetical protein